MILYGKEFYRPVVHSINILTPFNIPINIMLKKHLLHFSPVLSFTLSSQFQTQALWGQQGILGSIKKLKTKKPFTLTAVRRLLSWKLSAAMMVVVDRTHKNGARRDQVGLRSVSEV